MKQKRDGNFPKIGFSENKFTKKQDFKAAYIENNTYFEKLMKPKQLKTPKNINEDLTNFCNSISPETPLFLDLEPEPWARQDCSKLNVMEYIKLNGGTMICGYRIRYNEPEYLDAERYAVWFNQGLYKDLTFQTNGDERSLFLPDQPEKQADFDANVKQVRWGKYTKTKKVLEWVHFDEKQNPKTEKNDDELWASQLTYETWREKARLPLRNGEIGLKP